jgi:hypothetical protein
MPKYLIAKIFLILSFLIIFYCGIEPLHWKTFIPLTISTGIEAVNSWDFRRVGCTSGCVVARLRDIKLPPSPEVKSTNVLRRFTPQASKLRE